MTVHQLKVNKQSSKKKKEREREWKGSNMADTWPLFAMGYIVFPFESRVMS